MVRAAVDADSPRRVALDPDAIAQASLSTGPLDSLKEEERSSAKAWTESAMKDMKEMTFYLKLKIIYINELSCIHLFSYKMTVSEIHSSM